MRTSRLLSYHTQILISVTALLVGIGLGLVVVGPQPALARIGTTAPEVTSPIWINSNARSRDDLRGKVVLVEFWTFGCFNCRNVEPYVKEWHRAYADRGLVIVGVHSPEFSHERNVDAVRQYVDEHNIRYPVAIDNEFVNWKRYGNRYWPAMYLIDKRGIIRYVRIGEGGYEQTEQTIRRLLAEAP
jgi:thiol-disulfide isomerase/thioredoxin